MTLNYSRKKWRAAKYDDAARCQWLAALSRDSAKTNLLAAIGKRHWASLKPQALPSFACTIVNSGFDWMNAFKSPGMTSLSKAW